MPATVDPKALGKELLTAGAQIGGDTWKKIEGAMRMYAQGYAQSLPDVARAAASGDITPKDAKIYASNATLSFGQVIANVTQAILNAVQTFIKKVIGLVKDLINKNLPFPIV